MKFTFNANDFVIRDGKAYCRYCCSDRCRSTYDKCADVHGYNMKSVTVIEYANYIAYRYKCPNCQSNLSNSVSREEVSQ